MSTPLVAQQRGSAWVAGLAATVGRGWQMEGADIGFVRPIGLGPLRFASITGRFGAFQDEGAFLFGSQGFVAGLALAAQTRSVEIIGVGNEQSPVSIGLDLTFEATGYLANKSPFPQGDRWLGLAVMPGVRTITSEGFGASIQAGPVVFLGRETDVRAFVGLHIEIPVARPSSAP